MRRRWTAPSWRVSASLLLALLTLPASTAAYTVSSLVTPGCHERLTSAALRAVRLGRPEAGPLPVTSDERALVADLEFTPEPDMADLGAATLLLSVRDNDLKGESGGSTTSLAAVHGNPFNQEEHCLRSRDQDEPGGTVAAIATCRAFIRGRVAEALEGLDAAGAPDPALRTALRIHLSLRGEIEAALPTFYVRIGQAIHALEDSYSHAYRTPDGRQITVVLNWIDEADGNLLEARDGPPHTTALDACDDATPLITTRRELATAAAAALLDAALDPARTKEEKMTRVDELLDASLTFAPGCTSDNQWCAAPERQLPAVLPAGFGCGTSGGAGGLVGLGGLVVLALLARRRRPAAATAAGLLAALLALAPGGARAAEPAQAGVATPAAASAAAAAAPNHPPPPVTVPVAQPGPTDPSKGAWGGYLGISGSVDKPAAAIQLGLRRRVSTQWTLGVDAEWNPWVSVYGPTAWKAGVASLYGSAILRYPLAYERFNLRTTVSLGASYLLFDLYGAPQGSLGLYGAISPLGLEWKMSRHFYLIINPLSISAPVPQLKGVPMSYVQYRFSLGLGFLTG
ncbi:MAG: hypothetical protein IPQ24_09465 [Anaeromyxobacter sp.]|nr:hypothetical protein [Anaeromyxobacter sp.]